MIHPHRMSLMDKLGTPLKTLSLFALTTLLALSARAEVRSLTLGINVNCPPGLGECWGVGIGEGVAKMPAIASVAEVADGITQTAVVRPKGGRLVSLPGLAKHIVDIQLGATLRSTEATVDGWLERRDGDVILKVSGTEETLLLAPLTAKTQWDRRAGREFPALEAERKAYENLLAGWPGGKQAVRIIGPLRVAKYGDEMTLEVREAYGFSEGNPRFAALDLGIKVSSPYGLGEPWSEARTSLQQFNGITHVASLPDSVQCTARIQTKDGQVPDLVALGTQLGRIGIGAELTGVETTLEGQLVRQNGQLALKLSGVAQPIPLAPLTHKIQWDTRQQRVAAATSKELSAYQQLAAQSQSAVVRLTGPVIQPLDRSWTLLEVRAFEVDPPSAALIASGQLRDQTAPAALGSPRAIVRSPSRVFLDWDNSSDADAVGYHVYRSSKPDGRFTKVTRKPVTASEFEIAGSRSALKYFYAVTVIDQAGNESARSLAIDARPPAAPKYLLARPGQNAVRLEWDPSDSVDLDSYSVRRAEKPSGPYAVISVGINTCNYTDHGAENGRTYHYVITAVDSSSNESVFSNESTTTPVSQSRVAVLTPER
jgi:hypothetical protein